MYGEKAEFIGRKELEAALAEYLRTVQDMEPTYIQLGLIDFEDSYTCEWLQEEYLGHEKVDGVKYEVRACWTDFWQFPFLTDGKRFCYYTLIHLENLKDTSVEAYRNAKKLYVVNDIDEDDFPEPVD